jgi:hypothetical protein
MVVVGESKSDKQEMQKKSLRTKRDALEPQAAAYMLK